MTDADANKLFTDITAAHPERRFAEPELRNFCRQWLAARQLAAEVHGSSLPIAARITKMPAATAHRGGARRSQTARHKPREGVPALTDEQTTRFVAAINRAGAELGLTADEVAALLLGCASEAAVHAWGEHKAADEVYLLGLQLARRAGLDDVSSIAKSMTAH